MARYNKRRFKPRRRFRKKARGKWRAKVARIATEAVAKTRSGVKTIQVHEPNGSVATPDQTVSYFALGEFLTKGWLDDLGERSGGQLNQALQANMDGDAHRSFLFYNMYQRIHFRHLALHPIFMTIWEIRPRKSFSFQSGTLYLTDAVLSEIHDGYNVDTGNYSAAGAPQYVGNPFAAVPAGYTPLSNCGMGGYYMNSTSNVSPSASKGFNSLFKITNKKTIKLMPGDDVHYTMKAKKFRYNPFKDNQIAPATGVADNDVYKGLSRCILVRIHGALGHGIDDPTKVGYMAVDMAVEQFRKANACIMETGDANYVRQTVNDAPDTTGLEGPSENVYTVDDA